MSNLKLENISKFYPKPAGAKLHVLGDINISVESFENESNFVSILASFKSGKTTLLKIISAIEMPDSGKVLLGNEVYYKPAGKIVLIPEKPSSFPWLNVEQNINFPMKVKSDRVKELIDTVGLTGYENHHPHNESLGFRFRISLARALAVSPDFILMDDPFRRMNSETKDEIYELLKTIEAKYMINFILATTNVSEAIYLSKKVYLMGKNPGKIIDEIKLDAETLKSKGLKGQEIFVSLRNEIEKTFQASGEMLQTEMRI